MTEYGTIRSYDTARGTGTISPEQGGDVLPFRKADMRQQGQEPRQDQRFSYITQSGDGGHRRAVNLQAQQDELSGQERAERIHREQARNQAG